MPPPGFAFHFVDVPTTTFANFADLPPRMYDAFLDTSWKPVVTNWLSADLGVRVGVYSDFNNVRCHEKYIYAAILVIKYKLQTFCPKEPCATIRENMVCVSCY